MTTSDVLTIELQPRERADGQRCCVLCGEILSDEVLAAQRENLVGPWRDHVKRLASIGFRHRATELAADRVMEIASAPFERGLNWCYCCAYGAQLATSSLQHAVW